MGSGGGSVGLAGTTKHAKVVVRGDVTYRAKGGDHSTGEDTRSRHVTTCMRVKLNAVMKDRAHGNDRRP